MTDPELADATYVEPITPAFVEKVIAKERPDACLPTLGGQTGLNTAVELAKSGVLEQLRRRAHRLRRGRHRDAARSRKLFNECMADLGIEVSRAGYAYSVEDALRIAGELGFPVVLRPSFTMGGAGGGIARDEDELVRIVSQGLELSASRRGARGGVASRAGRNTRWRSCATRPATASSCAPSRTWIAMGVHTGDSITVAPAQTLTDLEYQRMRAASLAVLERDRRGHGRLQRAVRRATPRRAAWSSSR